LGLFLSSAKLGLFFEGFSDGVFALFVLKPGVSLRLEAVTSPGLPKIGGGGGGGGGGAIPAELLIPPNGATLGVAAKLGVVVGVGTWVLGYLGVWVLE